MEFSTLRMKVRRITRADYDAMFAVYGDLELMRFVGDSNPITREDCARWIDITLDNYQKRGYGLFIVEALESDEHIGFVGLTHPGGRAEPEIKYVIRQVHRGKGMAQELVAATCDQAHDVWNLDNIVATVHPDNAASSHVLAKCGFVHVPDMVDDDGSVTNVWEHRRSTMIGDS